jgi:hypothetical protein
MKVGELFDFAELSLPPILVQFSKFFAHLKERALYSRVGALYFSYLGCLPGGDISADG